MSRPTRPFSICLQAATPAADTKRTRTPAGRTSPSGFPAPTTRACWPEFWADGPDSETPPGHWFTILNYVNDHPALKKRFRGQGPELSGLEWDVKTYFALGGAVHDAAIAAWGLKGWYDYIRPISAIRGMAERGQSTDPALPRYDPAGIPLVDGFVELVRAGDALAGAQAEHVGKVKLYAWRGPGAIERPESDVAGVGWILAENWWPYQRPSFVTPRSPATCQDTRPTPAPAPKC